MYSFRGEWSLVIAVYFTLAAAQLAATQERTSEAPPGVTPPTLPGDIIPETGPVWHECFKQPSFWDRIVTCRTCSPGFFQQGICFARRADCGAQLSLARNESVSFSTSVECDGVSVSVSATHSTQTQVVCPPAGQQNTQCMQTILAVCYPSAELRVWRCEREVPVEREFVNLGGGEYCFIVTKTRTEVWYTAEFDGKGNGQAGCQSEDQSCVCESRGFDCECGHERSRSESPPPLVAEPTTIWLDVPGACSYTI